MTNFSRTLHLPSDHRLGRESADYLYVCTTDPASHLNLTLARSQVGLLPDEAKLLRDALIEAYPTTSTSTFSEIKCGETVLVALRVVQVDRRGDLMFRLDAPEWFNAEDAIGYVAPPKTPIEAGQLRRFSSKQENYRVLLTPEAADTLVCCRYAAPGQYAPVLLNRSEVEAAQVVS